jgi:hypothetical protein
MKHFRYLENPHRTDSVVSVSSPPSASGQVPIWNGSEWVPETPSSGYLPDYANAIHVPNDNWGGLDLTSGNNGTWLTPVATSKWVGVWIVLRVVVSEPVSLDNNAFLSIHVEPPAFDLPSLGGYVTGFYQQHFLVAPGQQYAFDLSISGTGVHGTLWDVIEIPSL